MVESGELPLELMRVQVPDLDHLQRAAEEHVVCCHQCADRVLMSVDGLLDFQGINVPNLSQKHSCLWNYNECHFIFFAHVILISTSGMTVYVHTSM